MWIVSVYADYETPHLPNHNPDFGYPDFLGLVLLADTTRDYVALCLDRKTHYEKCHKWETKEDAKKWAEEADDKWPYLTFRVQPS